MKKPRTMRELEEECTFAEADEAHMMLDAIEDAEARAREKAEAERARPAHVQGFLAAARR